MSRTRSPLLEALSAEDRAAIERAQALLRDLGLRQLQAELKTYSLTELAGFVPLGKTTIRGHVDRGALRARKIGGKLAFRLADVLAWLQSPEFDVVPA